MKCRKCKTSMLSIQYGRGVSDDNPCHYDGVSEFKCRNEHCGLRMGRWSLRELKDGEHEPPFGERHSPRCPQS